MYKILVADDEEDIVCMLKDYFEINGYEVISASNGKEAIAMAAKSPDIILLDVNMPYGDGISVCKKIRDYVSCPILFLTARVEDSDKITGFAAGGDDYIIKPFSIDELGARVAAISAATGVLPQKPTSDFSADLPLTIQQRPSRTETALSALPKRNLKLSSCCPLTRDRFSTRRGSTSGYGATTRRETAPSLRNTFGVSVRSLHPRMKLTTSKLFGGWATNG